MKGNRYKELDMLRGIAILAVILIHISGVVITSSQIDIETETFFIIINQLSRFAVPVFLFLSGLGLTLSQKMSEGYFVFLKKQILKILPLYLLWSVVYLIAGNLGQQISPLEAIKSITSGGSYYHLYYVPLIIIFYILYPFLRGISKNNAAIILILLITVSSQWADELFSTGLLKEQRNPLNWCIYFVVGIWFAQHLEEIKEKVKARQKLIAMLYFVATAGIVCEAFIYMKIGISLGDATTSMRPSVIIYSIIFVLFIMTLQFQNKNVTYVLNQLSKVSYGVYLSHAIILASCSVLFAKLGFRTGSVTFAIVSLVIVLSLSIIITKVVDLVLNRAYAVPLKKLLGIKS